MPREAVSRARRWLRWVAYAAGALALILLAAWLGVPPIARSQLETRLGEALERPTTVGSVAFNPLSLRLTMRDVVIAQRTATVPLLAVDEIVADISAASIRHRAPVFDSLKLVRPRISLARDREGGYSIQDIVDRALAGPAGPPPRFSLNNVEIVDGSIAFDDGVVERRQVLERIEVGIPFLSTLPYETAIGVKPRVAGTFNGAPFDLSGTTTPFSDRREATLDVDIEALALPSYVAYLPVKPRVDLAGGTLTARLTVAFVDGKPGERRLELRGNARVDALALKRRDGSPLVAAEHVVVAIDRIDAVDRDARIASVAIDAPVVDVKRLADGTLEWAQPLVERVAASPASAPGAGTERPWQVSIGKLGINRGRLSLSDQTSGFQSTLVDIALAASNVATKPGEKAQVKLSFVSSDRIASFSGEADVEPLVPAASGRFELTKFSLGLLFPYYKSALAVDVQKGSLDYASAFELDAAGKLRFTGGDATLSDLRLALPDNRNPIWRVPELVAHGVDVDVDDRKVVADDVQAHGTMLRLVRESDGTLEMSRLLRAEPTRGGGTAAAAWTVLAKSIAFDRAAIDFEDRVPQPAVRLAVRDLALTATDVTNAQGKSSDVTLRARVGERGRISFAGPVATAPLRASGRIDASGLALVPLKPYVEPHVNVVFTGGTVAAKGRFAVEPGDADAMRAAWKGDVSVSDFAALDKPTQSDLARWTSFSLEGLDVATAPFRASVGRIGIDDFYARVIVYQDGTLNLARLLTPGQSPEPAADAKPPAPTGAAGTREALPVSIGRVDFARGNVNFSDFFVKPNYSANLTDVMGSVSTMSEEQAGDVSVVARVDGAAPVEVQGHVHPFAKELSLDIAAKAHDIDLPPLTPYSVKYAGYGIEKGKLTFDVRYRVENRKLSAENHLVLDQLTFGERVESPTATKLPVLLAVALLKDANGVIDLNLPIGGSIDDPEFSVGGLVVRVIVNLLTKAAMAPFALLSAAFGGGEELSTVSFAAGSAQIAPDAQKRIDTLGKALADRPSLKLDIGGHADPVADRDALRRESVETAIKRAKMKALVQEGTAPASIAQVTIAAEERPRWLKEAYRDAPLADRPRNFLGMLKDVPPAEMEAMLYASATVDDDALRLLASRRAQVVKDAIATKGVPSERLFLTAPRIGDDAGDRKAAQAPTRVDLALR